MCRRGNVAPKFAGSSVSLPTRFLKTGSVSGYSSSVEVSAAASARSIALRNNEGAWKRRQSEACGSVHSECAHFVHGLFVLGLRIRVEHDATTRLQIRHAILHHQRAQRDCLQQQARRAKTVSKRFKRKELTVSSVPA